MKFYESQEYICRRRSTGHLRKIRDIELAQLFLQKVVLEIGCGANPQSHLGNKYVGVDISFRALKESKGRGWRIQAEAKNLPFRDETFDGVITIALLEHIPDPEQVICEIGRILRPGGIILHSDAWNVPSWRSLGLPVCQYHMLKFLHKILKFFLPLLESLPARILRIFPKRTIREIKRGGRLDYILLRPNYDLPEASDADACSSIDSHSVLLFYKAKGFKLIKPGDRLLNRLFHRGIVIVKKQ